MSPPECIRASSIDVYRLASGHQEMGNLLIHSPTARASIFGKKPDPHPGYLSTLYKDEGQLTSDVRGLCPTLVLQH